MWHASSSVCLHGLFLRPLYTTRSAGGKGVEENVITLCPRCHSMYDQGIDRGTTAAYIEEYLKSKYPHWDKELLIYKKGI
jgi:5-methylcytosine-specific restriction endonuclease McrA